MFQLQNEEMHKPPNITKKFIDNLDSKNEGYAWILFLIAPIITFVIAIRNFKNRRVRKFIIFFGGFYGLVFIPIPDADATRYQSYYADLKDYNFNLYWHDIMNLASTDNLFPDMYAYTMFFIGKFFSDNSQFFFMIIALVYFFVFVKLIGYIYDSNHNILKKNSGLFFIGILFLFGFSSGINGVRWPLAIIVYLLGAVRLLTQNNIKYLLLAVTSVFIHFSFYPAVIALAAFYFIPFLRKPNVLFGFALVALFAGTFFSNLIFSNAEVLGDIGQNKLSAYTAEGYVETRADTVGNWNFYVAIYRFGNYFFAIAALTIMWFSQKKMISNKVTSQLFGFAVLMTALSFMANAVVDLSTNRYLSIVSFLTLTYLIYMGTINEKSKIIGKLIYCYAPIIALNVFLTIKVEWQTISILLLSNPILAFFL